MKRALRTKILLGLLILALGFAVFFFWPRPFEGTWERGGGENDFAWYVKSSYRFHYFSEQGYPPLSRSGLYVVKRVDGDTYTLLVWVFGSEGSPAHLETQVLHVLDANNGELDGAAVTR